MSQPRLEDWFLGESDLLFGRVYGHPTIPDGEVVRTSRVGEIKDGKAFTKNSVYELGRPLGDE